MFPSTDTEVPLVWSDPTATERVVLTAGRPDVVWSNDLSSFATATVEPIQVDPPRLPLLSLVLVAAAAGVLVAQMRRRRKSAALVVSYPLLIGAAFMYPFVRTPLDLPGTAPSRAETAAIVESLLTNVYRSFELRDEEAIYDRLAVSVTGDQLQEVYLENRRALELENRGGARAQVDDVEVLGVTSVRRNREGGYRAEVLWTISGSVNHFGHVHYRQNRYDAEIDLQPVDGIWKIRHIEILEERRVL